MNQATWTTHSVPRRRLAVFLLAPALAAAVAATSLMLAGPASVSSPPVDVASAPVWTALESPWAEAVNIRDLKRQLVGAGYQVRVDDSLDPVTKSAFADYLTPGTASSLGAGLARAVEIA